MRTGFWWTFPIFSDDVDWWRSSISVASYCVVLQNWHTILFLARIQQIAGNGRKIWKGAFHVFLMSWSLCWQGRPFQEALCGKLTYHFCKRKEMFWMNTFYVLRYDRKRLHQGTVTSCPEQNVYPFLNFLKLLTFYQKHSDWLENSIILSSKPFLLKWLDFFDLLWIQNHKYLLDLCIVTYSSFILLLLHGRVLWI